METPILWQFTSSHYNEKARWALDFKHVPHIRRSLVPGFHAPVVKRLTGATQVPVLKLKSVIVADSSKIIEALERAFPEPSLYPADAAERRRALELEEYFDEELGPYIRRWMFFMARNDPWFVREAFIAHASLPVRLAHRAMSPLLRRILRRRLDLNPVSAEVAYGRMLAAMVRLEQEVGRSGYLAADRFTVADLTAAALFSPIVRPREFPYRSDLRLPEPIAKVRAALESRPAFQWTLRIYRQHRGGSAEITDRAKVSRREMIPQQAESR